MSDAVETFKMGNNTIDIVHDDISDSNPLKEWDNMGKMVCFHRNYNLGHDTDYRQSNFDSWDELEAAIIKDHNPVVILPLYLYDHSGITIATAPFSCGWDSGQVGFIYADRKSVLENYCVKKITKKIKERATELLIGEVKVYDQYLTGDVYGWQLKDEEGNVKDSCWGYFGLDSVREEVEAMIKNSETAQINP